MALSPDPACGSTLSVSGVRPSALSGNALAVASMLTWAIGFPAAELLLESWPTVTLFAARMALAVVVLVPVWLLVDGPARVLRARWGHALFVGGIGIGGGMFLILLAQKLTDPVTVAIIASSAPLIATVLELVAGTRRLRWNFALGVGVSIIGGLIATSAVGPAQLGLGAGCAILSTGLFCWASMVTARDFRDLSPIGRGTITLVGGLVMGVILVGCAAMLGFEVLPAKPVDLTQTGMLIFYAVLSLGLSQVFFIAAVGKLGVALTSFHINIAPFYVMVIMVAFGDEWNSTRALGAGIVALAVVLAQDRRGPRTA